MKKTLYTLNIDNYEPEITALTFPFMKHYAKKIGADFYVIDERKFPEAPIPCEKFQIYDLGKEHKNDWNIFFDADTLIHPDFWDITTVIGKDTTVSNGSDFVPHRFTPTSYHMRDGRMFGKGNWCGIASDWCLDYWHPYEDGDWYDLANNIHPTVAERRADVTPQHLIDDYVASLNIARYGLKHELIPDFEYKGILKGLLFHIYLNDGEEKLERIEKQLKKWGIAAG